MAYRTRLTVSTEIRKTIEGIRTRTKDRIPLAAQVKICAATLVKFFEENRPGSERCTVVWGSVEVLSGVLAAIRAHFQTLEDGLEVFKADDTSILGTKEIELAEDLIRVAMEGSGLEEFLRKLNTELVEIIYLQFSGGRDLDAIDQFIRVAEVIETAKTELSTL